MSGPALAAAAEALVGTPFRLHGRDPASGLDCIGVFAAAMAGMGRPIAVPNGYAMRLRDIAAFRPLAAGFGFTEAAGEILPGDVLMFTVGPVQFHLGIAAPRGGLVHAHAGLRRVVIGPASADWQPAGHWRFIQQD
jgi:cell wall-associated NlpC family hydrolase